MATQWLEADTFPLQRLAWMIDEANRGGITAALEREARQLEDRYGLSPITRRRLEWDIAEGCRAPAGDKARRLRAVEGSAD